MPIKEENEEQLFLLEVVVESVTIEQNSDECCVYESESPWLISFWLINTFSFELQQEDDIQPEENISPQKKVQTVKFHAGKSCLFSANPTKFTSLIQENPIYVSVQTQPENSVAPDVLGHGKVDFDSGIIDELKEFINNGANNAESSKKGCYPLYDCSANEVGHIKLFIRLSYYGKSILSEFKLMDGMDNILFKVQKEEDNNRCYKCGKRVKSLTSEGSVTFENYEFESEENFVEEESWKDVYSCPLKTKKKSSHHVHEFMMLAKEALPSSVSRTPSRYESLKRFEAHINLEEYIRELDERPSREIHKTSKSKCRYNIPRRVSETSEGNLSEKDADSRTFDDEQNDPKAHRQPSAESIDFRKVIGPEHRASLARDDTESYIAPILDRNYDRDQDHLKDRIQVTDKDPDQCLKRDRDDEFDPDGGMIRPPKLKAGPRRKKRFTYMKGSKFVPGVKLGHKECVNPSKQVPKRMGWLWTERSDKRRGWKPGALTPAITKMLESARADSERDRGDSWSGPTKKIQDHRMTKKDDGCLEAGDQQPSLRFQMRGGSYLISMNPAAVGDKSKEKGNQKGLFLKICKKGEEDAYSSSSDLEFEFITPNERAENHQKPIQFSVGATQYLEEDFPAPPLENTQEPPHTAKGARPESQKSNISKGSKSKAKGKKGKEEPNSADKEIQVNVKDLEVGPASKKEKGGKTKIKAETEPPAKLVAWEKEKDQPVKQGKLKKKK